MTVVLTGGTGLIGSAVLRALLAAGHEVTAIVRSDASAATVSAAGASAVKGELTNTAWLRDQLAAADGAIHTASPGDATSADFDTAVVAAAVAAYDGTGKPFVHTGGIWVYGSGTDITEDTPFDPPALTSWRTSVEKRLLDTDSLRGVVVEPGIVYGTGQGLPGLLTQPDDAGNFRLIGDGAQHWTTVSAEQIADLYLRAYENPDARGYYIGANDDQPTVRELVEAAAAAAGTGDVIAETADESRGRLFAPLVDALLLDQVAGIGRARKELGWQPGGAALIEEFRSGSYAPAS